MNIVEQKLCTQLFKLQTVRIYSYSIKRTLLGYLRAFIPPRPSYIFIW